MLSELQQKGVWEGWLSCEIRANYFADLAGRYRKRQRFLTWLMLLFSSGAFAAIMASEIPESYGWLRRLLAFFVMALSLLSLVQKNEEHAVDCSDLHFRWSRLAREYRDLWDDLYSDEAATKFKKLEEEEAELSKKSISMPYRKRIMAKWQDHVQMHHRARATA